MNKTRVKYRFAFRLSLYILTCFVITFLSVLIYNYNVSKDIILEKIEENAKVIAALPISKISDALCSAQQIAEDIPNFVEYSSHLNEKNLLELLKKSVESNYEVYGCGISFEPYMFDKAKYYFDPYFYKPGGVVKYQDVSNGKDYDYFKQDWYIIPKKLNKGVWSEPYFDKGGGEILMVTYSQPCYRIINGRREFCGVVTSDIDLDWLGNFLDSIKIFKNGYIFILSSKGVFIGHKNMDYRLKENIFSLAENKRNSKLKELGEKMINGQYGFEEYYSYTLKKKCFVSYAPLKETGWSVGVVIPADEFFSDLNIITLRLFIIVLVGCALVLVAIIMLANRITIHLRTMASATHEIGKGEFKAKLSSISSKDEIGALNRAFCVMQENLKKYIANLQKMTAAKERIEKEFSIASAIQRNLLPHKFPHLKQFDLYATLIPAKEVGGNFYNFFFIDEKHLCLVVGDVSEKGVPAALLIAVVKTLLNVKISFTMDPAKILNTMNEDLCKDNKSYMFVTFFLGILNIETGVLEYCNAGHNPPLIHTVDKGFYYHRTKNSYPPLGSVKDVNYVGNKLELLPEDVFFLYTDGVIEAMNIDKIQFSEEKLIDVLDKNKDKAVPNIVSNVKIALEQHVSGITQSDDITMLILKYNG